MVKANSIFSSLSLHVREIFNPTDTLCWHHLQPHEQDGGPLAKKKTFLTLTCVLKMRLCISIQYLVSNLKYDNSNLLNHSVYIMYSPRIDP